MRAIVVIALIIMSSNTVFGQLATAERMLELSNWKVLRTKNSMTDKLSCVAIHRDNYSIQLKQDALYLSREGKGGVAIYQIRIDEAAATKSRRPGKIEQQLSTIILTKAEVQQLVGAKRLRVSGLSVLNSMINEDLDIDGIATAHAVLASPKCK